MRTESSAAASFASASLDGGTHHSVGNEMEQGPNVVQKACSSARGLMHHIIAVAIPAWLLLKRSQFQQWTADGEAKADAMGILRNVRRSVLVIPFASAVTGAKGPSELFIMLNQAVYHFVNLYLLFLFIRVILSWFPAFDWERTIWRELRQVTDPYLNIFTGIVPPLLGAIDLTPLLGFFVLQALKGYLTVYTDDDIEAWW